MINQERLETNLLQLFAYTKNWEWFSIVSVIIFEVNIVSEHVNAKRMTVIVRFCTELKQTVLNSWYVKTMGVGRRELAFSPFLEIGTKNQNFLENLTSAA